MPLPTFCSLLLIVGCTAMLSTVHCHETCTKIRTNTNGSQSLWLISFTSRHVYLISTDLMVFQMPNSALDTARHTLDMSTTRAVPMRSKWPHLWTKAAASIGRSLGGFLAEDTARKEYLFVVGNHTSGTVFNVATGVVYTGVNYQGIDVWLSGPAGRLYSLVVQPNGNLLFRKMASVPLVAGNGITLFSAGPSQSLCINFDGDTVSFKDACTKGWPNAKWSITRGFVAGGYFYLFNAQQMVYILSVDCLDLATPKHFSLVTFKKFFICPAHDDANTTASFPVSVDYSSADVSDSTGTHKGNWVRQPGAVGLKVTILLLFLVTLVVIGFLLAYYDCTRETLPLVVNKSTASRRLFVAKVKPDTLKETARISGLESTSARNEDGTSKSKMGNSASRTVGPKMKRQSRKRMKSRKLRSNGSRAKSSSKYRTTTSTAKQRSKQVKSLAKGGAKCESRRSSSAVKAQSGSGSHHQTPVLRSIRKNR